MIEFIQKLSRYISADQSHQSSPLDDFQSKLTHLVGGVVYAPGKLSVNVDGESKEFACQAWHRSVNDCFWSVPELNQTFLKKSGHPFKFSNGHWVEVKPQDWIEPFIDSGMCINDFLHIKSVLSDFDVNPLGETILDDIPMTKWAMVPISPQLGVWNKIVVWYHPAEKLVAKMEFYNQNLDLQRVMTFTKTFLFAGVKFPKLFKVVDILNGHNEASYEIDKIEVLRTRGELKDLLGYRNFVTGPIKSLL